MSNEYLIISVAKDFSDAPGARYRDDGPDSGQEFYEEKLRPAYLEAVEKNQNLLIDMDGAYGYATSFISEAFGRLGREFDPDNVLNRIRIKSDEDPLLTEYVFKTIKNPDI